MRCDFLRPIGVSRASLIFIVVSAARGTIALAVVTEPTSFHEICRQIRIHARIKAPLLRSLATRTIWPGHDGDGELFDHPSSENTNSMSLRIWFRAVIQCS